MSGTSIAHPYARPGAPLLLRTRLVALAALTLALVMAQGFFSREPARTAHGVYFDTRPAGATVCVWVVDTGALQGGAVRGGLVLKPVGRTPGALDLRNQGTVRVTLRLWGYDEVSLNLDPQQPRPPLSLRPRIPVVVPFLYFLRDWGLLVVALGLVAAGVQQVLAYRGGQHTVERGLLALALSDLGPGARLGPYILQARLGQGGMAQVFRAVREDGGEAVAVKIMSRALARDPESLARFRREIDIMRSLSHPHVAFLLDWGQALDFHYLVMELVEGTTLAQEMDRGPVEASTVQEWAVQVCRGLVYAHERGVVHRDLKPSNLMLTPGGRIKIMDFGIARRTDLTSVTAASNVMGTPGYMAPELLQSGACDWRVDYYSLGAVLYEALAGRPLFEARSLAELLARQATEVPTPLGTISPNVPAGLEAVVMKMLAREPRLRALHPGEFLECLEALP